MPERSRKELTEKSIAIVEQSHISAADKKILSDRIPFVADVMLQMFIQVCEEDPFSVDAIVVNMKKKLDAQGNLKRLHEIVKQECRELEEVLV
jgi:hypothetical protein